MFGFGYSSIQGTEWVAEVTKQQRKKTENMLKAMDKKKLYSQKEKKIHRKKMNWNEKEENSE